MTINFKRYINTTIMVAIPTLFHDTKARPFKLLGVELPGVWLQSEALTTRLLPDELQHYAASGPAVFVPFAHIAGIVVPTSQLAKPLGAPATAPATSPATAPAAAPVTTAVPVTATAPAAGIPPAGATPAPRTKPVAAKTTPKKS